MHSKWSTCTHTKDEKIVYSRISHLICFLTQGSRKKNESYSLNGRAIKRGGGVKGRAIKEKELYFKPFFPTFQNFYGDYAIKGVRLNGPAIKRRTFINFFAASRIEFDKSLIKFFKIGKQSWKCGPLFWMIKNW